MYVKSTLGTSYLQHLQESSTGFHDMPPPSIPTSNSQTDLCTHGWWFTGWSLAFIFKSLQFIVEAERVPLYLHDQQWVSFVLLAGSRSVSLSHRMPMSSASRALTESLAFWLRRNQSGRHLPPKSHYPPCLTAHQSPPPATSLFSLTWCCYIIHIWWIQVQKSTNSEHFSISIDFFFYPQDRKYWFPNAAIAHLKLVFDRGLSIWPGKTSLWFCHWRSTTTCPTKLPRVLTTLSYFFTDSSDQLCINCPRAEW